MEHFGFDLTLRHLTGFSLVETDMLPLKPTPGRDAKRIVRHGLADVLRWLGEPVGPEPGEATHALMGKTVLWVSPYLMREMGARL